MRPYRNMYRWRLCSSRIWCGRSRTAGTCQSVCPSRISTWLFAEQRYLEHHSAKPTCTRHSRAGPTRRAFSTAEHPRQSASVNRSWLLNFPSCVTGGYPVWKFLPRGMLAHLQKMHWIEVEEEECVKGIVESVVQDLVNVQ